MAGYFAFRLLCDFLKPDDVRILLGLTAIQWSCIFMLVYYASDIWRWITSIPEPKNQGPVLETAGRG